MILPSVKVALGSVMVCWLLSKYTNDTLFNLIILLVVNSIVLLILIYMFGINHDERKLANEFIKMHININMRIR